MTLRNVVPKSFGAVGDASSIEDNETWLAKGTVGHIFEVAHITARLLTNCTAGVAFSGDDASQWTVLQALPSVEESSFLAPVAGEAVFGVAYAGQTWLLAGLALVVDDSFAYRTLVLALVVVEHAEFFRVIGIA